MLTKLQMWMHSDEGATALEYGILVAVIALIILVGVGLFGNALNDFFAGLSTQAPL
jgi:pilus assembly protein Flp/PilA